MSSKSRKRSPDPNADPRGGLQGELRCRLEVVPDGRASLTGPLTFDTAAGLFRTLEQGPPGAAQIGQIGQIDLAGVSAIDSAGLALLLEWQSRAQSVGRRLAVLNAPENLLRLARLCESVDLLGISGRETERNAQP